MGTSFCANCGFALTPIGDAEASGTEVGGLQEGALRPSGLVGLLSLTLGTYQRGFKGLLGIALVGQIVLAVVSYVINQANGVPFGTFPFGGFGFDISEWPAKLDERTFAETEPHISWLFIPLTLFSIGFSVVMSGAVIHATAVRYAGRDISLGGSYGVGARRAVVVVLSGLVLLLLGLPVLVGLVFMSTIISVALGPVGVVISIIVILALMLFLMVSFAVYVPAIIIERLGPVAALGRSWQLVKGDRWRLLGIGFVFGILIIISSLLSLIPGVAIGFVNNTLGIAVNAAIGALVLPLGGIAYAVIYLDLRIRKEGLTLTVLADDLDGITLTPQDA